jgi:hypothetical protein
MTALKGYRTLLINVFMSILPILSLTEFKAIIPTEYMPYYALGMVLANMGLRYLTTTPVGKK